MNCHGPVLQEYAEDAAAPSTPRPGKLTRTTRSTSKGSSPPAPSSNQIAEPSGRPPPMALSEAGMDRDELIQYEEGDKDIIATSEVTISKLRRAKAQESPAGHLKHGSTNERQAPASRRNPPKTSSSRGRHWSQQECATLRYLCHGKDEALYHTISSFWEDVSSQIPGRTHYACLMKWREMTRARLGSRKKKTTGSSGARNSRSSKMRWSAEELKKLTQYSSQPAKACDWPKIAAQFPGRTARACYMKYKDPKTPKEVQSQGRPALEAEGIHEESEQENMVTQDSEGEVDDTESLD